MSRPLYVIGHRNPDTDSICSAIGYAHLKQALGEQAVAARAGRINAETRYVLERFGVPAPVLIPDLYPRARDIMSPVSVTIRPDQTIRELGQMMRESSGKSAAVIDDNGGLLGIVSLGDLARRYFEELEMPDLASAGVTLRGILAVLDGKIEVAGEMDRTVRGKIWIAAAKAETFRKLIGPGDIALAGDREDAGLVHRADRQRPGAARHGRKQSGDRRHDGRGGTGYCDRLSDRHPQQRNHRHDLGDERSALHHPAA